MPAAGDAQSISTKLDENLETEEVRKAIGFLIKHVNLWSIPTAVHILSYMIDIVGKIEDIPPSVQTLNLSLISCSILSVQFIQMLTVIVFSRSLQVHW